MTISADPDQLASSEANWSWSTLGLNIILSIKHTLQQQIHCINGNIFGDKCCCNLGSLYFSYCTFDLGKDLVLVKTVQTPLPCSASAPLPSRRFYYWSFFLYPATYWCRGIVVLLSVCMSNCPSDVCPYVLEGSCLHCDNFVGKEGVDYIVLHWFVISDIDDDG